MAVKSGVTVLIQHLNREILLLERLHVLSQTEALVLENPDLTELDPVVRAKERLISEIDENQRHLAVTLAKVAPPSKEVPVKSRESLELLKQRALQLVELVVRVDKGNRLLLEKIKAQAVQSAQILHQDQKLRGAYSIAGPTLSQFSTLAD